MLGLLLAGVLAQSNVGFEPVVVLIASKRPGADAYSQKVAAEVVRGLSDAGATGAVDPAKGAALLKGSKLDPRACQGATPCLLKVAKALGPRALVVGVDVGKIGKSLAVHLEAVATDTTDPLAVADFTATADELAGELSGPVKAFSKELSPRLQSAPPLSAALDPWRDDSPKPPPPPLVPSAAPAEPLEAVTVMPPAGGRSKVLPWVLAGGAVASLGLSGTFALLGSQDKAAFDGAVVGGVSTLPASEFQQLQDRGNGRFTVALTTAAIGVALGAVSAALLVSAED